MFSVDRRDEELGNLIALVYEAAFDVQQWQAVLSCFSQQVHATASAVYLHDFRAARAGQVALNGSFVQARGLSDSAVAAYAIHYAALNPWARNEDALKPGVAVSSSMLYDDSLLPRTEFHGDWLRHQNLFYSLGGVVDRDGDMAMKFAFMRPKDRGEYQPHEINAWQLLFPHVRRAARLHLQLAAAERRTSDVTELLDTLAPAWVMLDAAGRAQDMNSGAARLLQAGCGLSLTSDGRCRADDEDCDADLQRSHRAALDPKLARQVRQSRLELKGPRGRLGIDVLAMPGRSSQGPARVALLLHAAEAAHPTQRLLMLQQRYGLTASESALAVSLAQGMSLAAIAEQRMVSIHTVRTQLKAATAKTGVSRQAELVRLVLGLGPLA